MWGHSPPNSVHTSRGKHNLVPPQLLLIMSIYGSVVTALRNFKVINKNKNTTLHFKSSFYTLAHFISFCNSVGNGTIPIFTSEETEKSSGLPTASFASHHLWGMLQALHGALLLFPHKDKMLPHLKARAISHVPFYSQDQVLWQAQKRCLIKDCEGKAVFSFRPCVLATGPLQVARPEWRLSCSRAGPRPFLRPHGGAVFHHHLIDFVIRSTARDWQACIIKLNFLFVI